MSVNLTTTLTSFKLLIKCNEENRTEAQTLESSALDSSHNLVK